MRRREGFAKWPKTFGSGRVPPRCQPGSHRDPAESTACVACNDAISYTAETGAVACETCPAYTMRVLTYTRPGVSLSECVCRDGYYASAFLDAATRAIIEAHVADQDQSEVAAVTAIIGRTPDVTDVWGAAGVPCLACPEGGVCAGLLAHPKPIAGYWGAERELYVERPSNLKFFACAEGRCRKNFECAHGFEGRLCSKIRPGHYFAIGGAAPIRCPRSPGGRAALGGFLIAVVFYAWYWFNFALLSTYSAVDILTYYMQIVAILIRFKFTHAPPVITTGVLFPRARRPDDSPP